MTEVGLRELRQNASELVRSAEAGAQITITLGGRPAARLVPAAARRWRRWDDIADLFRQPPDEHWARDRELVDHELHDPWDRR